MNPVEVVRLGALADYETEEELSERLRGLGLAPAEIAEDLENLRGQFSIQIQEFAILADGRRLVFDERGFSGRTLSVEDANEPADEWAFLTIESIEEDVRDAVAPDDDGTAAEYDHDWDHIAVCLGELGVHVSAEELMRVPYDVVLSERLLKRLSK